MNGMSWQGLHPLRGSGSRPPHPHEEAHSKSMWPPIQWTGISFEKWGGAPDGTEDAPEKHPLPWDVSLYASDLVRKYIPLAMKLKSWTIHDLARHSNLPEDVVKDIVNYGYGWTPDLDRIIAVLGINSPTVPPECY